MDQEYTGFRNLVGKRWTWFAISLCVIIAGMVSLALPMRGLNVGIDFTGGNIIQYPANKKITATHVKKIIGKTGIRHNPVQVMHGDKEFLVRTEACKQGEKGNCEKFDKKMQQLLINFRLELTNLEPGIVEMKFIGEEEITQHAKDVEKFRAKAQKVLDKQFEDKYTIKLVKENVEQNPSKGSEAKTYNIKMHIDGLGGEIDDAYKQVATALYTEFGGEKPSDQMRLETVSPVFSSELFNRAIIALIIATFGILIYVWIRFELWFAIAAIVALIHDCLITLGFFSILHLEVNVAFVAIMLTVFGYSINDSIVIFDRIRENIRKDRKLPLDITVNRSLWETMPRSINTTLTTQFTILAIIIFGGITIRDFSMGIFVGIMAGAYSSIFVAAPIAYMLKKRMAAGEAVAPAQHIPGAKKKAAKSRKAKPEAPAAAAKTKETGTAGAPKPAAQSKPKSSAKKGKQNKGKQRRR